MRPGVSTRNRHRKGILEISLGLLGWEASRMVEGDSTNTAPLKMERQERRFWVQRWNVRDLCREEFIDFQGFTMFHHVSPIRL